VPTSPYHQIDQAPATGRLFTSEQVMEAQAVICGTLSASHQAGVDEAAVTTTTAADDSRLARFAKLLEPIAIAISRH
jgi:hypothetical protein